MNNFVTSRPLDAVGTFGAAAVPRFGLSRKIPCPLSVVIVVLGFLLASPVAGAQSGSIHGSVVDPLNAPVAQAHITLVNAAGNTVAEATSTAQGSFTLSNVTPGVYQLKAEAPSFLTVVGDVSVAAGQQSEASLQFQQIVSAQQQVTVVASAPSSLTPDPAQSIIIHDQVLDANPSRPGAPISLPGLPIETASGGIKAPQYFAPGVAGDHGEPIAQFFQVGSFLYPNNLPANAHGNGYADPNVLIPPVIEGVTVDGGHSTSARATTLSISLRPMSRGSASAASSNSPATITMRMSWRAGVPRIRKPTPGSQPSCRSATAFSSARSTASSTS